MVRLSIELPETTQAKLRERAANAGVASVEEYVQSLLEDETAFDLPATPSELTFTSTEDLAKKLRDGLASPATEMTDADWDDIKAKVRDRK